MRQKSRSPVPSLMNQFRRSYEALPNVMTFTRRNFLRHAAAGSVLLGVGGSWAISANDGEWSFPFIGDLHFDQPDHHDMDWLAREHPNDVSQVRNYCRITREVTPKLLAAVQQRTKESRTPIPLIVQIGDL